MQNEIDNRLRLGVSGLPEPPGASRKRFSSHFTVRTPPSRYASTADQFFLADDPKRKSIMSAMSERLTGAN